MVIWGSKGKTKTIGNGNFYCPHCKSRRTYEHKTIGKYFTLYFIPLFETEKLGEFIECMVCKNSYKTEVLELSRQIEDQVNAENQVREIISEVKSKLNSGMQVQVLMDGMISSGMDKDTASKLLCAATDGKLKKCNRCGSVYKSDLIYCSNCGMTLEDFVL
jgi:hypothetical protein